MTRFDTAYLELTDDSGTGVFELNIGLQESGDIEKTFLMGPRGQYITEVFDIVGLTDVDSTAQRRAGFVIDGGAGTWQQDINFATGLEDVTWGDGSGGDGPSNVTARDASGADVKPLTRKHVLELWIARSRTDSQSFARLYHGEWATGNYHSEAGAFNQPMPCAITNLQTTMPNPENDPPSELTGTVSLMIITPFSDLEVPGVLANSNVGDYAATAANRLEEFSNE